MIQLNDYLYSGDTVLKILHNYIRDLEADVKLTGNPIDKAHYEFLMQLADLLEHNDFLTAQSQRLREFYKFMVNEYPHLAFTFKGRIKSLIRAEEKFNGNIVEYIYDYYNQKGHYPSEEELLKRLNCFRDLIAYRIVVSIPSCHLMDEKKREESELKYLYDIANHLPDFLGERGFIAESSGVDANNVSDKLTNEVKEYYRDYIYNKTPVGYQSLHITFYDTVSKSYLEVQLRTKQMDDYAEIGPANHLGYEQRQDVERARRDAIPEGGCVYFDDAYERGLALQKIEMAKLDVNMFGAMNNSLINDGCGLLRGRLILPYEHLSRFQNDIID